MKILSEQIPVLAMPSPKSKASLELSWAPDQRDIETQRLWRIAVYVSIVSFIVSIILCVAGIVCTSLRSSASTAAFAADCLLDALTSVIVFWRYYRALRGRDANEHTACIYLGALLLVSACAIIAKAIADIITQPEAGDTQWLLWLSCSASLTFLLAAAAKYWLFRHLRDESILMDAVNTALSGVFCVVVAITVLLIDDRPDLWYLDPVEGGVFAVLMAVYGLKCILDNACRSSKDLEKSMSSYIIIP